MDTLTHTLAGIAISRAGFKGRLPFATTALVIAANIPDIDLVAGWNGMGFIAHHRGLTHSLLALPVFAVLIAWGLRWAAGYQQRRRPAGRAAATARPLAAPVAALPGQPAVKNIRLEDLWPEAAVSSAAAAPELAPPPR
ncbi:MAG: metal-dependent hydrolase, partial [Terriglobales bacterium]